MEKIPRFVRFLGVQDRPIQWCVPFAQSSAGRYQFEPRFLRVTGTAINNVTLVSQPRPESQAACVAENRAASIGPPEVREQLTTSQSRSEGAVSYRGKLAQLSTRVWCFISSVEQDKATSVAFLRTQVVLTVLCVNNLPPEDTGHYANKCDPRPRH